MTEMHPLELEKLRTDIRFARLGFFAQIANTLTIAACTIGVLYLFQLRQIEQMETARQAAEKTQVAGLVMTALNLKNDTDKAAMISAIGETYDQYPFVRTISKANAVTIAETRRPSTVSTGAPQVCSELETRWQSLKESFLQLINDAELESAIGRGGRRPGPGAVYMSLRAQSNETEAQIKKLESELKQAGCRK